MLSLLRLSAFAVSLLALFNGSEAATAAQWRTRSIYQLLTDRFARTDGSTSASCPPGYQGYCGGTYKGIMAKLDYIQVSVDSGTTLTVSFSREMPLS